MSEDVDLQRQRIRSRAPRQTALPRRAPVLASDGEFITWSPA